MGKLDGSCLCGKVAYSCDADPLATVVCHCRDCQKQTGTTFSIIVAVPHDALQIDWDTLGSFTTVGTDSEQDVARKFCRECGSPVASIADALPQVALIKAGTLDDTSWLEPTLHVWTESAQAWFPFEGHAEARLPRGPSS